MASAAMWSCLEELAQSEANWVESLPNQFCPRVLTAAWVREQIGHRLLIGVELTHGVQNHLALHTLAKRHHIPHSHCSEAVSTNTCLSVRRRGLLRGGVAKAGLAHVRQQRGRRREHRLVGA